MFTGAFTATVSFTTVTIISVDRLLAVSVPHKVKIWSTASRAKIIAMIVIIFNLVLSIRIIFTWSGNEIMCYQIKAYSKITAAINIMMVTSNIISFLIILLCSIVIGFKLHIHRRLMAKLNTGNNRMSQQQEAATRKDAQISKMLLAITILFLLTSFPISLIFVLDSIYGWSAYYMSSPGMNIFQVRMRN
jgi:hypothetical protein